MKYFTLLISFILLGNVAIAQTFTDLTASDSSLYWFASHDPTSNSGTSHYETSEHFIGHDTTIHGIQYAITYNGLQRQFIRTDAQQRVYALDLQDTIENLLFAFGAQAGDTVRFHGFVIAHSADYFYSIDSIGTTIVDGGTRRVLYVSSDIDTGTNGQYFSFTWIEGVGEQTYGLHSIFVPDINNGFSFCGQYQDTAYVYIAHLSCYRLTGIREIGIQSQVHVYPTPTEDILTIENNSGNRFERYNIVDASGRSIYMGGLTGNADNIYMNAFPSGIYCLLLYDDKGDILTQRVVKR